VRSSIRGRAGVLDAGSESGGALLLAAVVSAAAA